MNPGRKTERFNALDLSRFFAALAVVLYHYTYRPDTGDINLLSNATKFGYLGVPLFFIISGFVICASAQNRTALEFAASRFARLYPAYWAGIAITLLALWLFAGQTSNPVTVLANITMLNDYVNIDDIDGVYWTLHVELKFYALTFFLILFGWFDRYKIWLTVWLLLTLIHHVTGIPRIMGWFISPSYSCYFIAGISFFLIWRDGRTRYLVTVLGTAFGLSIFKAFDQAGAFITSPTQLDGLIAGTIVAGCFLLFWLIAADRLRLLRRPAYLVLGGLTYPLYLIHNLAGKAVIDTLSSTIPAWAAISATIVLMLLLSLCVSQYVEKPFATPLKKSLLHLVAPVEKKLRRQGIK